MRRVLIVRLGAIGDVVNALSLAAALKAADASLEIGWAVHDLAAPLVRDNQLVDRVHLWKRGSGLAGVRALLSEVRAAKYDVAVDLQRIFKSAMLARLSGAERVVGWDRARAKEGAWLIVKERIRPGSNADHMAANYAAFARHLGVEPAAPFGVLALSEAALDTARGLQGNWQGPGVVLNLGASKVANRWPAERFGLLAQALGKNGFQVIFTGGPGDLEAAEVAMASGGLAAGALDLVGQTNLAELTAVLSLAALFIGCDTGPMHMAVAVGCKTVVLFGPADPRRTGPFQSPVNSDMNTVLQHAPAGDWRLALTSSIEVGEVHSAAKAALGVH